MKTAELGHAYLLQKYPSGGRHRLASPSIAQTLTFRKEVGEGFPYNEPPSHDGTSNQEVLRTLIYRMLHLQKQQPCSQNIRIIECLRTSLYLHEYRAAERKGLLQALFQMEGLRSDLSGIENFEPCPICGHIFPHDQLHEGEDRPNHVSTS